MADDSEDGFGEAARGFAAGETLETYEAMYRLVLTAYGYRCALTGEQFERANGLWHGDLDVVAIVPRELGGPLKISNYLPLVFPAAEAFEAGQWLIADDYAVLADRDVLDRRLAERLHPSGFLQLPKEAVFHPDRALLARHRERVLAARPD